MLTPPKSGQPRDQSEVGTEDPVILSTNGIHWTAEREDEGQTVQDRRRELLIQQGLAVNNGPPLPIYFCAIRADDGGGAGDVSCFCSSLLGGGGSGVCRNLNQNLTKQKQIWNCSATSH